MQNGQDHLLRIEDSVLVSMAQQGDDNAFVELMNRHQPNCMKVAISILRHREDAEDEVQNAVWKAYKNICRFQQDARFSTWLTRIVVNQCLMRLRRERRRKILHIDDVMIGDEVGTMELPDSRQTPEESLAGAEVAEVLRTETRRMPLLLRNVFILRDVERRPMQEVAEELGVTVAAAKSRLLRARKELRSRLARHLGQRGLATLCAES